MAAHSARDERVTDHGGTLLVSQRNFNGIMDDRNHQGELFGVKNVSRPKSPLPPIHLEPMLSLPCSFTPQLFSLREDGRGIMETAQRIEEIETDVTGVEIELEVARVDATFKFDEDAGNSLKVSYLLWLLTPPTARD